MFSYVHSNQNERVSSSENNYDIVSLKCKYFFSFDSSLNYIAFSALNFVWYTSQPYLSKKVFMRKFFISTSNANENFNSLKFTLCDMYIIF